MQTNTAQVTPFSFATLWQRALNTRKRRREMQKRKKWGEKDGKAEQEKGGKWGKNVAVKDFVALASCCCCCVFYDQYFFGGVARTFLSLDSPLHYSHLYLLLLT